jgi:hypothetical protein
MAIASIGALCVAGGINSASAAVYEVEHTFSVEDLIVTAKGKTFGEVSTRGASGMPNSPFGICDIPGYDQVLDCPQGGPVPFTDKEGVVLYPVNTYFGFNVADFVGASPKTVADFQFEEGFIGNIPSGGVKISNSATARYKVPAGMGTWCQGLGGNSVKCSTEHYTVMEHVLSCNEVIPYKFADPVSGVQAVLDLPAPFQLDTPLNCSDAALDDNLLIVGGDNDGVRLTDATPGAEIDANDNTSVLQDIAKSTDYSVTLKDDGKPLYRWGSLIKRPNDVRLYARMALPDSWKQPGAEFNVLKAELQITHWITNNPNDQVRPEDLENEAATGRTPSYQVESDGDWTSTVSCFEGDGDIIDTEEGGSDPTVIGVGTVLKNSDFALDVDSTPGDLPGDDPYAFSSDLVGGFTNAYYTSINRDPFEWSYVNSSEAAVGVFNFVGSPLPLTEAELAADGLELVSGPRWRLKPNKFGQDIPGLEIPRIECSAPPFTQENIKYEVGAETTTVINLLDWDEEEGPSPLATTKGWVDVTANEFVTVAGSFFGVPYTTNGLPMTDDFDLAIYIKGDRKPTALFTARLVVETDEPDLPAPL